MAGVLDKQTESGINGMLHAGVVPTLGANGQLSVGAHGALAVANTGDMALTGIPTGANISTTGGLTDTASLSPQSDPNSPYNPLSSAMPAHSSRRCRRSPARKVRATSAWSIRLPVRKLIRGSWGNLPSGESLVARGDHGDFAKMDANGQWHALDANGKSTDITAGANGQWIAAGHVPVEATGVGTFASTDGHCAFNSANNTFSVGTYDPSTHTFGAGAQHDIPAAALSGQLMHEAPTEWSEPMLLSTALERPGVADNIVAAAHGDQGALAAVQQGLWARASIRRHSIAPPPWAIRCHRHR